MKIGYIGLGKMGTNMVERLLEKKYQVVVYDLNSAAVNKLGKKGAIPAESLKELCQQLKGCRLIWVMVPHQFTSTVIKELTLLLRKGDIIIDGGNSPFKQSVQHAKVLAKKGVHFLDVGVSGGPKGARNGACLMIGGKQKNYKKHQKLFRDLSAPKAYGYMGPAGAGHFVKMVHNGIEYGMMQSIAEGFSIMKKNNAFKLDLTEIASLYNQQSVISSRLIGWMQKAFKKYGNDLGNVTNQAGGLGEGKWTVDMAHQLGVRDKVLHEALKARQYSKNNPNYQARIIMALRNQFGGHSIKGNKKDVL